MSIGTVMTCKAGARRGIDRICNGCAPSGIAWQWHGSEELSVHRNGAEMQSAVGTGNGVVAR